MLGRGGSWVGNTVAGLQLGRYWLYQDFAAGTASPLTISANSNGSGGSFVFDASKIVDNSAVATKTNGNPIFSNNAELSTQLVTTTNTGATVTLSATPAIGEGTIRVWYLYVMNDNVAPQNMEIAPDFVRNARIQFFDARYLEIANALSELTGVAATARTNIGFTANTTGRVLIGDGTSVPTTDSKLFFDTTAKALAVNLTAPGTGATLDVGGTAGGIGHPVLTTTQRDAITPSRNGVVLYNSTTHTLDAYINGAWVSGIGKGTAHSTLTGLTTGDDHTQYALLAGRSGGQQLDGDMASGGNLTLMSTAHATKGKILFGNSAYDEANNRLYVGFATLSAGTPTLAVKGANSTTGGLGIYPSSGSEYWTFSASGNNLYLINPNSNRTIFNILNTGQVATGLGNPNGAANLDNFLVKNANGVGATSTTFSVCKSTSQTGDLTDWYDTDGTTKLARVTVAGLGVFTGVEVTGGNTLQLDGSSSGFVALKSPASPTSFTLTYPGAQGAVDQALINNGSGTLTWATVAKNPKAGKVTLANGVRSKAITFATARADALYTPYAILVNTTDTDPLNVPVRIIALATTGFTAEWSDLTDSANYLLYWGVKEHYDP